MTEQYGQTFTTTDGSNVTYIQFLDPSQAQLVYGNLKEEQNAEYYESETEQEPDGDIIEESYIEEDLNVEQYEVLEEVVVEPKKSKIYNSETHQITKKLVQVKGECFKHMVLTQ